MPPIDGHPVLQRSEQNHAHFSGAAEGCWKAVIDWIERDSIGVVVLLILCNVSLSELLTS